MFFQLALNFWSLLVQMFAPLLVHVRLRKGLEHATRFPERYGLTNVKRPAGELIWFHGASVGEGLSILPLIEKIIVAKPNANFLITTTTTAAAKVLEMRVNDKTFHQFVPFDAKPWVNKFLDHWQPSAVFFVESEIWPNLLVATAKRKVKAYLLNARLSKKSLRNWLYIKKVSQKLWKCFSGIYTQSDEFTQRFGRLGASAQTLGNIKLLSQPLPFDTAEYSYWKSQIGNRKCWIVASTHSGEEAQIFEVHKKLKNFFPDLLTIIAPRHMQRIDDICQLTEGINIVKFSGRILADADILLVDALAKLGVFYRICRIAFVGGSLIPQGGHNPLEPAILGTLPIWGPYFFNFDDMMPIFKGVTCQQHTQEHLVNTLEDFFNHPEKITNFVEILQKNIIQYQQAIDLKIKEILKSI
jgi:3-deoxy-D-manno-octulosonic-acid transferase